MIKLSEIQTPKGFQLATNGEDLMRTAYRELIGQRATQARFDMFDDRLKNYSNRRGIDAMVKLLIEGGKIMDSTDDYVIVVDDENDLFLINRNATTADEIVMGRLAFWPEEGSAARSMGWKPNRIQFSTLQKQFIGKGLGKALYTVALKHTGTLFSNSTLYTGSLKMWTKTLRDQALWYGGIYRVMSGYYVPIPLTEQDAKDEMLVETIEGLAVSVKPPKTARLMAHNLRGQSITKGDFSVIGFSATSKENLKMGGGKKLTAIDLIDDSSTLPELVKALLKAKHDSLDIRMSHLGDDGIRKMWAVEADLDTFGKPKTLVLCLDDLIMIVKEQGGDLTQIPIR